MMIFGFVFAAAALALAAMNVLRMNRGQLFYLWCGIPVQFIFAGLAVFFILLGFLSLRYRRQKQTAGDLSVSENTNPGKRTLYLFEIAVYLVSASFIGICAYFLSNDALDSSLLDDHIHQMAFALSGVPCLLSFLPVSPAAKGKKAPGLAILSFILVILIVLLIGVMCVAVKIEPQGTEVTVCVITASVLAVILFIQSIRRLRRS